MILPSPSPKRPAETIETIGKFIGICLAVFIINCLRAYLLSICVAIFFPSFVLGFWQWWLISYTFVLFISARPSYND